MDRNKSWKPTYAEYVAAISEFDYLWESCAAEPAYQKMRQLLIVIEAFEQHTSCVQDGGTVQGLLLDPASQ